MTDAALLRALAAMLVSGPTKRFVRHEGEKTEDSVVFADGILTRLETDAEVQDRLVAAGLAAMGQAS